MKFTYQLIKFKYIKIHIISYDCKNFHKNET